ncbi:low molecular weight protein arginine phosphatase [Bacillus massilinigeriensis]|uniref:low molecular weight protein arginine phosphatase n=1 Tax=Bacillus massilionigeriensis TaxID=1805475 RepID=UPI00096B4B22|nr:low molecular weight protein arginine phosphatase [Bacillus massilionigeriensis]
MTRILFVCTGNTCRSPMAEAIVKSKSIPNLEVKSAGVFAMDGGAASENTQAVLKENQIEHNHRSQMLSTEMVKWATYILTMTSGHKSTVLNMFPEAKEKTFTITEFVEGNSTRDIADPYGGSIEIYRDTYKELNEKIEKIIERIQKES